MVASEGVVEMTEDRRRWGRREEPSPTNDELFRDVKPFTTMEEFVTWEDPFESDEEYEAFLADLYDSRRRCPNCASTTWPEDAARRSALAHGAAEQVVPGWTAGRGVTAVSDEPEPSVGRLWGAAPSPTTEELVRSAGGPIRSIEALMPSFDLFGSDEEHGAFLEWLHDLRRRG